MLPKGGRMIGVKSRLRVLTSRKANTQRKLVLTPVASKELPRLRMQKWGGQDKFLSALPRPPAGPLAVEKLTHQKMRGKTLQ
jgi:hypothetical protein